MPATLWGGDPIPCLAAGTPHGIIMIQSLSRVWFPQGCFILPTEITSRGNRRLLLIQTVVFLWKVGYAEPTSVLRARIERIVKLIKTSINGYFILTCEAEKVTLLDKVRRSPSLHVRVELSNNNNRIWVPSWCHNRDDIQPPVTTWPSTPNHPRKQHWIRCLVIKIRNYKDNAAKLVTVSDVHPVDRSPTPDNLNIVELLLYISCAVT